MQHLFARFRIESSLKILSALIFCPILDISSGSLYRSFAISQYNLPVSDIQGRIVPILTSAATPKIQIHINMLYFVCIFALGVNNTNLNSGKSWGKINNWNSPRSLFSFPGYIIFLRTPPFSAM